MPNINLFEGKEFSTEVDLVRAGEVSVEEQDVIQKTEEPADTSTEVEGKAGVLDKPSEHVRKSPEFGHRRSSSWPIVVIVAGALVITALIFLDPFNIADTDTNEPQEAQTQEMSEVLEPESTGPEDSAEELMTDTQTTDKPAEQPIKLDEQPVISEAPDLNRQQGFAGVAFMDEFLSAIPAGMGLSFFRYGGGTYLAEVAATSSSLFSDFEYKLSSASEGFTLEILSEQDKQYGGSIVRVRQIQGSVPISESSMSAAGSLDPNLIREDLTAKTTQNNLQLRQFDLSLEISDSGSSLRAAALKLFGEQDDVVNFIQNMLQSYGNVGLNKITISASSPGDFSASQVNAVLDIDVFL